MGWMTDPSSIARLRSRLGFRAQPTPGRFRRTAGIARWFLALWLTFGAAGTAMAHESIGSVSNTLAMASGSNVDYFINVPKVLVGRMFALTERAWYQEYFVSTIQVESGARACPLTAMSPLTALPTGNVIVHLTYQCEQEVHDLSIQSEAFLDFDDKHVQVVKLVDPADPRSVLDEGMLDRDQRSLAMRDGQTTFQMIDKRTQTFVVRGVEHILTGYDHVLFVIAIILMAAGVRDTIKIVTAFTVAHSITLVAAFFSLVSLPSSLVEPLIALTIIYVAFENLFRRKFQHRWLLTFVFGLVHGLGFVTVLGEITGTRTELVSSLVAFNIGIELGQLLIVIPAVLALRAMRGFKWRPMVLKVSSIGTAVAGLLWLVERVPFAALAAMARRAI